MSYHSYYSLSSRPGSFNLGLNDTSCPNTWTQGTMILSSPNMCDAPLVVPIGGVYETN